MVLPTPRTPDDFKFASEEDIRALRTMISMLTIIQQMDRPNHTSELAHPPPGTADPELKELKVLSALATVLVMEHEVVAVVAKHDKRGNIGTGGVVEVVASTDSIIDEESESPATHNPRFSNKSKTRLEIHNQADDFQDLTKEELLEKFKAGTKKEKDTL